tara:strand:- start:282 stop:470 length:189 start_codon:yes stop_codon:yes gene_type:complete
MGLVKAENLIYEKRKPSKTFDVMFAQFIVVLAVLAVSAVAYDRNELVLQDNIPDVIKTKQRK